jgi:hypothetical protein
MAGVWEEALVEEAIYLMVHLAQSEQHLMEIEGGDKVGGPNAHNRRAEEQKEDGGGCALFSPEDRRRKGKGRIPHKA